ncbi:iron-containing alcohol dehydrogenase [Candidatus Sumerlaeota bacterium]|nr:iron-containing alcohol dehydrogenase [Candidatus Sumerlaeota bacterium]
MKEFRFHFPVEYIFGPGKIKDVGTEASSLGSKRAFIVSDPVGGKFGWIDTVKNSLSEKGIEAVIFDKVEPNPTVPLVDGAADIAKENSCDLIIGIGGGSSMDVAKGVAVMMAHPGTIWEYVESGPKGIPGITSATYPLILIPTTAGTASETTRYAVITHPELRIKETVVSKYIFPKVAIVDPELMSTMPPEITATTGADAFCQSLEGYTSRNAQPLTDLLALESMRLIYNNLPRAIENGKDIDIRGKIAWGVSLSGIVIAHTGCTAAHAMSHPITAHFGIPHGIAVVSVTPATMRYNLINATREKYIELARTLGAKVENMSEDKAAEKAIELVTEFLKKVNVYKRLSELNVEREKFDQMTKDTLTMGALKCDIRDATYEDIYRLFEESF